MNVDDAIRELTGPSGARRTADVLAIEVVLTELARLREIEQRVKRVAGTCVDPAVSGHVGSAAQRKAANFALDGVWRS